MKSIQRSGKDKGSVAVEFVLVLPVLLLVVFGIIDLGRLLNTKMTLSQAAHEGARAAAVVGEDAARSAVAAVLGPSGSDGVTVTACGDSLVGGNATVSVTKQFAFTTLLGGTSTLTATAVVPCL